MENNYSLKITDVAKQDITSSLSYIANDLSNKKAADELYAKLNNAFEVIIKFPFAQSKSSLVIPQSEYDLRKYSIENYILYYGVKKDEITVLRFIYGGRDIDEKYF